MNKKQWCALAVLVILAGIVLGYCSRQDCDHSTGAGCSIGVGYPTWVK